MEADATSNDAGNHHHVLQRGGLVHNLDNPTIEQSGFCSVVFGCFSACFAVWLGKSEDK